MKCGCFFVHCCKISCPEESNERLTFFLQALAPQKSPAEAKNIKKVAIDLIHQSIFCTCFIHFRVGERLKCSIFSILQADKGYPRKLISWLSSGPKRQTPLTSLAVKQLMLDVGKPHTEEKQLNIEYESVHQNLQVHSLLTAWSNHVKKLTF